jgi:amino acid adenylation domain-containing protein
VRGWPIAAFQASATAMAEEHPAFPLSAAQRRIWYAEQFSSVGATYVVDASMHLAGSLQADALAAALVSLSCVHPILRLAVQVDAAGRPWQRVGAVTAQLGRRRLQAGPLSEREAEAWRVAEDVVATPFRLPGTRLFQAVLLDISPVSHLLVITYHHLLGDAVSSGIIRRDLMVLYREQVLGQVRAPAGPADDYRAVVMAEELPARAAGRLSDRDTTLTRLSGAPSVSTIKPDAVRPPRVNAAAHWLRVDLPRELSDDAGALAVRLRASKFLVYSTALHLLVQRYSGQHDTLVGFLSSHRLARQRSSVGLYAQTLIQRLNSSDDPTGAQAIRRLRQDVLAAAGHAEAQLEDLAEGGHHPGADGTHPFFQVVISYIELGDVAPLPGLTATPVIVAAPVSWLDLELRIYVRPDGTEAFIRCPMQLYQAETVQRLGRHYLALLSSLVADPDRPVSQLGMLSPRECAQVEAAGTGPPGYGPGTVSSQLEAQFSRNPGRTAVKADDACLTYAELKEAAGRLAGFLRARGIGPGQIVAISAPRSAELVIAVAGVVMSGAAFLAIECDQPGPRRLLMVQQARPALVLVHDASVSEWPDPPDSMMSIRDALGDGATAGDLTPAEAGLQDLAYVIYTSGSTGDPKAVGNTQAGLFNRLGWMQANYPIQAGDTVLQKTPLSFDVSVWELLWPLTCGARLLLARPGGHKDPEYLGRLIRDERVTVAHFVPSMLAAFVAAGQMDGSLPLRHLICSGEVLPASLCQRVLQACAAEVHNLYGPAEAAIDVTSLSCRGERISAGVPIGRPAPGTRAHVMDPYGRLQPFGAIGELWLGGVQLARGYLGQAALTAQRFVSDPLHPGGRLYRTGDLARARPDGIIEYLGRLDRQVKIRGSRVEPAEVEAAIERVAGVRQAVVVVGEDRAGHPQLIGFACGSEPGLSQSAIMMALTSMLPDYLVPARIHVIDEIPATLTGKADHRVLLELDARAWAAARQPAAPASSQVEGQLLSAARTVLGDDEMGIDHSFFARGGDSIRSIELVVQARRADLHITVEQVFTHPTVRLLAEVAAPVAPAVAGGAAPPFSMIDPAVRGRLPTTIAGAFPLSAAVRGLFVESSRPGRYRIYVTSLRLRGAFRESGMRRAVHSVIRRHPMLRSALWPDPETGYPVHVVHADVPDAFSVIDLRATPHAEEVLQGWLAEEQQRAFDWFRTPLLRMTAHVLGETDFALTLAEPMLDGYSAALLLTEVLERYLGIPHDDGPADVWGEYLQHEQQALVSSAQAWRDMLGEAPDTTVTGLDGDVEDAEWSSVAVDFPADVAVALPALSRLTGVPVKALLLAAHVRVLTTLCHQTDVVTGVMSNGRPASAHGVAALGLFINVNALRVQVRPGTWLELAQQVHDAEVQALPHRSYPFSQVQHERLAGKIHALFNYTRFHPYERLASYPSLQLLSRTANDQTYLPLTAQFMAEGRKLRLVLEFFGAAVPAAARQAMATLYTEAVCGMTRSPHTRHDKAAVSGGQQPDRRAMVSGPDIPLPDRTLEAQFLLRSQASPGALAVRSPAGQWTYAELRERAWRLAGAIAERGVAAGDMVGVALDRTLETASAHLAVLAAGAVCLPLDQALPVARRRAMLADARCRVVITHDGAGDLSGAVPLLAVDEQGPPVGTRNGRLATDAAYLVYTSGSTGKPEGVLLSHQSILNRLLWGWETSPFAATDVVAARTPAAFVDAIPELLSGILAGALTYLVPEEGRDPSALLRYLAQSGATRVTMVPALLERVLNIEDRLGARLPRLRRWNISGEAFSAALAHRLLDQVPGAVVTNLYGSTEVTADATAYRVRGDECDAIAPIGAPISNCSITVLDPWGLPVPRTVTGQLAVSGAPVSAGYLERRGESGRFIAAGQKAGSWTGDRAFLTGDMGLLGDDGILRYAGRRDRQLKIRGVRLESTEIEAVLCLAPGVAQAAVAMRTQDGEPRLVAFLVPDNAATAPFDVTLVRQLVLSHLPAAALPTAFALVPELPLTPSGKIDRRRAEDSAQWLEQRAESIAPTTLVQRELARLWRTQLGVPEVSMHSDFFALGGDSLHAIMLAAAIRDAIGVSISLRELYALPRLTDQADLIKSLLLATGPRG